MVKPINVSRDEFPMSNAKVDGMISIKPIEDNYEIYYEDDVEYISRGNDKLYLQIIGPIDAGEKLPLVVFIPGSAFKKQNVKWRVPQLSYLAKMGFVVALLEYRGSEIAHFPAQALDAKAGIRFMKKNADKYHIDINKVILMGDSSGAHTALMAAFSNGIKEIEEEHNDIFDSSVKGVIDMYGPINFITMNDALSSQNHHNPDSPEGLVMGGKDILLNKDIVKPAIITNYVSVERDVPPTLIFHGSNDELVPFEQSCELYKALRDANKDAEFYKVLGAHHGGREFWSTEILNIIKDFIIRVIN